MAAVRPAAAAAAAVPRVAALHTRAAALSAPTLSPLLTTPLEKIDPEIHDIIEQEKRRQWESLALIPSEVRMRGCTLTCPPPNPRGLRP
jgi:hypothetical protein